MIKRFFFAAVLALSSFTGAQAFDFDGIDLNSPYMRVAQEISKRGYYFDVDRNCLKGNCQGTEIYLNINYIDVTKKGMVGQLVVEIPMKDNTNSMESVTTIFNVVYHQVDKTDKSVTYEVDHDGTKLILTQKGNSLFLTYNTPYYKVKK